MAGHLFEVSGQQLCETVERLEGFKPFEVSEGEPLFSFREGSAADVPAMLQKLYRFSFENVNGAFGKTEEGFLLHLEREEAGEVFYLWCKTDGDTAWCWGNWSPDLSRFALWIGFGLMTLPHETLAIHSSCIVHKDKAVLFLGESGTGKSTHTRLWRRHIPGATLLNDDSPIVRIENGKVWAYGSAWSGKTPCYRNERHEVQAIVRLSQAPHNKIVRLSVLQGYAALHPSCAPEFAYESRLYDFVSHSIGKILAAVPLFQLSCLPDEEAAKLSCSTLFEEKV